MSEAIQQFLQIVRETWRKALFCAQCGCETNQVGMADGQDEIYTCSVCHSQKVYSVK